MGSMTHANRSAVWMMCTAEIHAFPVTEMRFLQPSVEKHFVLFTILVMEIIFVRLLVSSDPINLVFVKF